MSKTLVHRLRHRWLEEGDQAFQAGSSRPKAQPARTPDSVRDRVLQLREQLTRDGLDAGADTIHAHLTAEGHQLSRATVWRLLKRAGRVTPQPQKRPRSSYIRFNADRPNQMWQSDFTHWTCADGTEVEIIGWLDDHSRFLLHLSAHHRVTGKIHQHLHSHRDRARLPDLHAHRQRQRLHHEIRPRWSGPRAERNAFETLLALEGIIQENGRPYRPATQGKIERFWQTLKNTSPPAHPPTSTTSTTPSTASGTTTTPSARTGH